MRDTTKTFCKSAMDVRELGEAYASLKQVGAVISAKRASMTIDDAREPARRAQTPLADSQRRRRDRPERGGEVAIA